MTELAGRADIVLSGADDAAVAIGVEDPIGWFHDRGADTVVIKDGVRGATESDGIDRTHQPALLVPAVDPGRRRRRLRRGVDQRLAARAHAGGPDGASRMISSFSRKSGVRTPATSN